MLWRSAAGRGRTGGDWGGGGDHGGGLERGGTGPTELALGRIVEATGGTAGRQRRGTSATKLHALGVLKVTARTVHGPLSLMLVRRAVVSERTATGMDAAHAMPCLVSLSSDLVALA